MADHDHAPLTFPSRPDLRTGSDLRDEGRGADGAVFDALADMFLGPERAERARPDALAEPWSLELLVMGHLPVRARPWASQYAAVRAERDNTSVALLRVGGGYASVELFGASRGSLSVTSAPSLPAAVARVREIAEVCLVMLEDDDHTRALTERGVDAVTIIVGANDAAVVDAYRAIKSVSAQTAGDPPVLRVGVMGVADEQAEHVVAKLSEAADRFLGRRVESTTAIRRMGPTGAVSLFGDRVDLSAESLLDLIDGREPDGAHPETTGDGVPTAADTYGVEMERFGDEPNEADARARGGSVRFSSEAQPALVEFVDGARSIGIACPYDPDAVLATTGLGGLVVLRRVNDDGDALLETLEWAQAHRSILSLATNGRVRADIAVAAHAFVDDARRAEGLREVGLDGLHIHLLSPVPAGAAWMSTPV